MAEPTTCPHCGTLFDPEVSPQRLCPQCLLAAVDTERISESTSPPASRPRPPELEELAPLFPNLELETLLGQGGMGVVYRARHRALDRPVALKLLTVEKAEDPSFAERFRREARALAKLQHPGIVTAYDSGEAGPYFYVVMELVEGASLRQMLEAQEVDAKTALAIVSQICSALQYAHEHGVVHRDIKPENILVDREGRVKIADFGLARLTRSGPSLASLTGSHQIVGTPHYMSPEQWERPREVDHRADIYALGVVFYELLTGELPLGAFPAPSQRLELDVRLDEVVLRTLAKEPDLRYQYASELKTDVDQVASSPGARVRRRAPAAAARSIGTRSADSPRWQRWLRTRVLGPSREFLRQPLAWAAVACLLGVSAGGFVLLAERNIDESEAFGFLAFALGCVVVCTSLAATWCRYQLPSFRVRERPLDPEQVFASWTATSGIVWWCVPLALLFGIIAAGNGDEEVGAAMVLWSVIAIPLRLALDLVWKVVVNASRRDPSLSVDFGRPHKLDRWIGVAMLLGLAGLGTFSMSAQVFDRDAHPFLAVPLCAAAQFLSVGALWFPRRFFAWERRANADRHEVAPPPP